MANLIAAYRAKKHAYRHTERGGSNLDLGLDIVDGVAALDLESDGLPRPRLHEDLHTGPLILSMVSVGSMSISISFPVSVFTLIMVPPLSLRTKWSVDSF
jgi:hypothetical protein